MKITKQYLKQIIKEELERIVEADLPGGIPQPPPAKKQSGSRINNNAQEVISSDVSSLNNMVSAIRYTIVNSLNNDPIFKALDETTKQELNDLNKKLINEEKVIDKMLRKFINNEFAKKKQANDVIQDNNYKTLVTGIKNRIIDIEKQYTDIVKNKKLLNSTDFKTKHNNNIKYFQQLQKTFTRLFTLQDGGERDYSHLNASKGPTF